MANSLTIIKELIQLGTVVSPGLQGLPGPPGREGPPGPAGLPGSGSGTGVLALAGIDLSGHRVVRAQGDGSVTYASAESPSDVWSILGMTTGASQVGAEVPVVTYGEVSEPTWSWTPDRPVYLGSDGVLTQVVPTFPSSAFSLIVGFALTPTKLFFNPRDPLVLT